MCLACCSNVNSATGQVLLSHCQDSTCPDMYELELVHVTQTCMLECRYEVRKPCKSSQIISCNPTHLKSVLSFQIRSHSCRTKLGYWRRNANSFSNSLIKATAANIETWPTNVAASISGFRISLENLSCTSVLVWRPNRPQSCSTIRSGFGLTQ